MRHFIFLASPLVLTALKKGCMGRVTIALLLAGFVAGPVPASDSAPQLGPGTWSNHPALQLFGVSGQELPSRLFLVRTRGSLPELDGVVVHGVYESVFLVSGEPRIVRDLARRGCDVVPLQEWSVPRPSVGREWIRVETPDSAVVAMVDQVNWDDVLDKIQWLVDFGTRYSLAPNHQSVAESIGAVFETYGLTTNLRSFQFEDTTTMWTVEATQTGTIYPTSFVIICGHFDSISEQPMISAPGADDNATGIAAVLTAAEILSQHQFEYSILYLCFGGEEQGLKGSFDYVNWVKQVNLDIVGVLNFDMVGWDPAADKDLEITVNVQSLWMGDAVANAADLYTDALYELRQYDLPWGWSDYWPFWKNGYAAVNHEEQWLWSDSLSPYYHTAQDLIEHLDPDFVVDNVQVGVASLATIAVPLGPVGPVVFEQVYLSVLEEVVEIRWSTYADEPFSGFNVYRRRDFESSDIRLNEGGPLSPTVNSYTDTDVDPGKTYMYTVAFVMPDGSEVRSARVAVTVGVLANSLEQNRPNPFNPVTEIGYRIASDGIVSLRVYDVAGRLVRTLVNSPQAVGAYSVNWNGKDDHGAPVSTGVYFYRLEAGKYVEARRMVLLK